MAILSVNPFNNELIASFQEMSSELVELKVLTANETFKIWRHTTFAHRAVLLRAVAKLMREQKDLLAKLITLEMGKLINQSYGEIALSADIIDYYATHSESFLCDQRLEPEFGEAYIKSTPIGVLLGVEPWNFPFYQAARFAAPNLMAGNVVLVKHASNVPQCAQAIENLFEQAGAPEGLYTNLFVSGSRTNDVVANSFIKGVALIGSEIAGASIAATAGKYLKKSLLELGGSDAVIVLEDANIDKTVDWAIVGRMNNTGQCCVASKRFIVVEAVADEFLEKFKVKMSALIVGDPMDETTQLGPLSSEGALIHLIEQVQRTVRAGGKVLLGGKLIKREGAFMEATILGNIKPGMVAYHEELFGPVASFYRVKNEQEAVDLANDTSCGLGGSIFTNNIERGKRLAEQIDTGLVFIYHSSWTQPDLPFGGSKGSGYDRELSKPGIQEFVKKKLIRVTKLVDPF